MTRGLKGQGTSTLYARIPTPLYEAVQRIAADAGLTIAETAVRLLERGLDRPNAASVFEVALQNERER